MKYCIGFCIRKPCNCLEILEIHNTFRREMLRCAELREKGYKCTCIKECTEDADYWRNLIEKHTFENWYEANLTSDLIHKKKLNEIKKKVLKENGMTQYRWITISLDKGETPRR